MDQQHSNLLSKYFFFQIPEKTIINKNVIENIITFDARQDAMRRTYNIIDNFKKYHIFENPLLFHPLALDFRIKLNVDEIALTLQDVRATRGEARFLYAVKPNLNISFCRVHGNKVLFRNGELREGVCHINLTNLIIFF